MKFCTGKDETADKLPQLKAQSRRMGYGRADSMVLELPIYTRLLPCLGAWAFFNIEPYALVAAVAAAGLKKQDVVYFLVPERPVKRRDVQHFQDRDLVFRLACDEVIGGYIPARQVSPYRDLGND